MGARCATTLIGFVREKKGSHESISQAKFSFRHPRTTPDRRSRRAAKRLAPPGRLKRDLNKAHLHLGDLLPDPFTRGGGVHVVPTLSPGAIMLGGTLLQPSIMQVPMTAPVQNGVPLPHPPSPSVNTLTSDNLPD